MFTDAVMTISSAHQAALTFLYRFGRKHWSISQRLNVDMPIDSVSTLSMTHPACTRCKSSRLGATEADMTRAVHLVKSRSTMHKPVT